MGREDTSKGLHRPPFEVIQGPMDRPKGLHRPPLRIDPNPESCKTTQGRWGHARPPQELKAVASVGIAVNPFLSHSLCWALGLSRVESVKNLSLAWGQNSRQDARGRTGNRQDKPEGVADD